MPADLSTTTPPGAKRRTLVTISASDSLGLAGLQADNRALAAFGTHGVNIVSAITAQNNQAVLAVAPTPLELFEQQWQAANASSADIIKCGLLCNTEQLAFLADNKHPAQQLVWDPVLSATSKGKLFDGDDAAFVASAQKFLTNCTLITPNLKEAQCLAQCESSNPKTLAHKLLDLGAEAVVITGGVDPAAPNQASCSDFFACQKPFNPKVARREFFLHSPAVITANSRGSGCQFASLIAAAMQHGYFLEDAVVLAKAQINRGLNNSFTLCKAAVPERASATANT